MPSAKKISGQASDEAIIKNGIIPYFQPIEMSCVCTSSFLDVLPVPRSVTHLVIV